MQQSNHKNHAVVYVVDGARTPFIKARNAPGPFTASDLSVRAGQALLDKQKLSPASIDNVVIGTVMSHPDETNIARLIALRLGCRESTPAYTVQRNCASGLQAVDCAMKDIQLGRSHLALAGGTEAMSHAPLIFNPAMSAWLGQWMSAKTLSQRAKLLAKMRPSFLKPIISILRGLNDPMYGISMGQTAENLATRFGISRLAMDEFAVTSHQRFATALSEGIYKDEVIPLIAGDGSFYEVDDGFRPDSSIEKLANLKPFFDKTYGRVTPGNSSQITDGAAMLLLASEEAVKDMQLPVLGSIRAIHWAGLDPTQMGLGPVYAAVPLLQEQKLSLQDIDYWEINEAFAGQVLACLTAFNDETYFQQAFSDLRPLGQIDKTKINVDGGAIAMGHPVGASGARLVLHLLHVLKRNKARRGIAALCIGGGQGGAVLVETDLRE